jgi:ankyrin repeat protein
LVFLKCFPLTLSSILSAALIKAYPDGVYCVNKYGNTPLHEAAKHGVSRAVLELLIEKNPDAVMQPNNKEELPIDRAEANGATGEFLALLDDSMYNRVHKSRSIGSSHSRRSSLAGF